MASTSRAGYCRDGVRSFGQERSRVRDAGGAIAASVATTSTLQRASNRCRTRKASLDATRMRPATPAAPEAVLSGPPVRGRRGLDADRLGRLCGESPSMRLYQPSRSIRNRAATLFCWTAPIASPRHLAYGYTEIPCQLETSDEAEGRYGYPSDQR